MEICRHPFSLSLLGRKRDDNFSEVATLEHLTTGTLVKLRLLEVKGRAVGADSVTITRNEIMTALNKPEDFILAIVTVDIEAADARYVRQPFQREPDFAATSVNYQLDGLLSRATSPA
jgi:hypothetical protein